MTSNKVYNCLYSEILERYEPGRKKWAWVTSIIGGLIYALIIVVSHWLSLETEKFAALTFLLLLIPAASLIVSTFAESQSKERYIEDCTSSLQRKKIGLNSIRKFAKRASADVTEVQVSLFLPSILIVPLTTIVLSNLVNQPYENIDSSLLRILLSVTWGVALLLLAWMFSFPLRLLERANISTIILRACIEREAEIGNRITSIESNGERESSCDTSEAEMPSAMTSMVQLGLLSLLFILLKRIPFR